MKNKYTLISIIITTLTLLNFSFVSAQEFTKNLYFGMQNDDQISQLQKFLNSQSLYNGPITGSFYSLTFNAVKAFQTKQEIFPATGYFGPLTRAVANGLISNTNEVSAISTPNITIQQSNPATNNNNTGLAALSKQNALNVYNQILDNYTSLDNYLISIINSINSTLGGTNSSIQAQKITNIQSNIEQLRQQSAQSMGGYMTGGLTSPVAQGRAQEVARTEAAQEQALNIQLQKEQYLYQISLKLDDFISGEKQTKQMVSITQSQLTQLNSAPLSYFLTYQVSTDQNNPYYAISSYPQVRDIWVNKYNQYILSLQQIQSPTLTNTITTQPTYCSVQSPSSAGGMGSIICSSGPKKTYCTFSSPSSAGGSGTLSCY